MNRTNLPIRLMLATVLAFTAAIAVSGHDEDRVDSATARVIDRGIDREHQAVGGDDTVSTTRQTTNIDGRRQTVTTATIAIKAPSQRVTLAMPERVDVNKQFPFEGEVPTRAGSTARRPVLLQQMVNDNWRLVDRVKAQGDGSFASTLKAPPRPMLATFRALVKKSDGMPASASAAQTIGFGSEAEVAELKRGDGAEDWAWLHENVVWSKCDLTWSYNSQGGYTGSLEHVRSAVAMVDRESAFRFIEVPSGTPADITVQWASPEQQVPLRGNTIGVAWVSWSASTYIAAEVYLDTTEAQVKKVFNGRDGMTWGAVVMHEVGHSVGLDHASGSEQVMYPMSTTGAWGDGDKAGLAAVSSHC